MVSGHFKRIYTKNRRVTDEKADEDSHLLYIAISKSLLVRCTTALKIVMIASKVPTFTVCMSPFKNFTAHFSFFALDLAAFSILALISEPITSYPRFASQKTCDPVPQVIKDRFHFVFFNYFLNRLICYSRIFFIKSIIVFSLKSIM